jgi:hypothetical protein
MLQHRAGIRFWLLCMYEQYNNMRVIGLQTLACTRIRFVRCDACWNAAFLRTRAHVRISAKLPKEPAAYQLPSWTTVNQLLLGLAAVAFCAGDR